MSRRLADRFIHVETSTGDLIRTTPEHPFYIPGRGIVCAKDLKAGDRLLSYSDCLQNKNKNKLS
ncbi:hypothetical protein IAI27_11235, partial [Streptococcus pseudopneumoniae]|nr:hypothetical protein [Streptococcus pseudopneumoniae]